MNIGIKLSRINNEDIIWVIYFFIAMAALISDYYEKQYLLNNDYKSQKKFKTINITILIVALFIYVYFLLIRYEDITSFRKEITKKEVLNQQLGLISALLFLIGGVIQLYMEINSDTVDDIETA